MTDASDEADQGHSGGETMASGPFRTVNGWAPPEAPAVRPDPPRGMITEFGEEAYCEAYPDIHAAINSGLLDSAAAHFRRHGRKEHRLSSDPYLHALVGGMPECPAQDVAFSVDAVIVSQSGTALVVGWTDDRTRPLRSVSVIRGTEGSNTRAIGRCRRTDVDALLAINTGYSFGFWIVLQLQPAERPGLPTLIRARLADGSFEQRELRPTVVSDAELRETILGHFAALEYNGNRNIEAFAGLDTGLGQTLTNFNRFISASIVAAAHAEYYGPRRDRFKASLIVCLFGKIEYFFLQCALFARCSGMADYELIYVSNSPELTEALHKEARIAELIYGLSLTVVTLPGNAGFSAANNVAARFARSDRLIFINPDVFPRDTGWCNEHANLIATLPPERTALFGAPLYYDDGSLMHGGMHFEIDRGLSVKVSGIVAHDAVRVEHYGKGTPAWSDRYTRSRPVPAVTGAFISADRDWFHLLGGFSEEYVFGHYEDADLCLKSLQKGVAVWLHDIRFWHLEGKGSVRRPAHEGGSLVNRWLFNRRWGAVIAESLVGLAPTHKLLNPRTRDATDDSPALPPAPVPQVMPELMPEAVPPSVPDAVQAELGRLGAPPAARKLLDPGRPGAALRPKRIARTAATDRHG